MSQWKYRFKTEEEFKKEYGAEWTIEIYFRGINERGFGRCWLSAMDYLLGTVLEKDFPDYTHYIKIIKDDNNFTVTKCMLTENKPKIPNYEPRKIIREI